MNLFSQEMIGLFNKVESMLTASNLALHRGTLVA